VVEVLVMVLVKTQVMAVLVEEQITITQPDLEILH